MTDDADLVEGSDELPNGIVDVLARADVWEPLPAGLESAVLQAVAEAVTASITSAPAPVIDLGVHRRRSPLGWWFGAAAAAALVIVGAVVVVGSRGDGARPVEVALSATALAPGASATATFESTPAGLKIVLDADDLPRARADYMYEAWIGDGDITISCGTFHLRGGDSPIELWAGTVDPRFSTVTVTIEKVDGDASSSGEVVLRGKVDLEEVAEYDGD